MLSSLYAISFDPSLLKPTPITADWVLEGSPQARAHEIFRSADGMATLSGWDCTAGRFRWYFGVDETVQIVEGSVTVTYEDGSVVTLKAGDIAYFTSGSWATWQVDSYVRKFAFCRHTVPGLMAFSVKATRKLMQLAGLRKGAPMIGEASQAA